VRRGSILQLVGLGVLFGGAATLVAVLIPWLPPVASKQRDRIDFVFWFTTGISIAVFALVAAVIAYSLVKFRVRPDDDSDGPPIHGHTGVEIVWTAVPAVLVTAISIVSAIALVKNDDAGKDPLNVNVTARQFAWTFSYPGQGDLTSAQLRLPLGRTVKLHLRALDVIHSFWVPEFGQKQDAVPGHADQGRHLSGHLHRALRARPRADADVLDRDEAGSIPGVGTRAAERRQGAPRPGWAGGVREQRLRQLPHPESGKRNGHGRSRPR
jgi:heme/copper-type cytochrome/quinol oxidase subunit 2